MSPVVSTEDGKTAQVDFTCRFIINLGKSVKVVGMSKKSILYEIPTVKRPNLSKFVTAMIKMHKIK